MNRTCAHHHRFHLPEQKVIHNRTIYDDLKYPDQPISELCAGQHLCWLYKDDEDHKYVTASFFKQGIVETQKLLYVGRSAERNNYVRQSLMDHGIPVQTLEEKGQLEFKEALNVYLKEGTFEPDYMINLLKNEVEIAEQAGYSALRATGEMYWALGDIIGNDRVFEYEALLNVFFAGTPNFIGLCQYDTRAFPASSLLQVLNTHPYAVRDTEVFENFYYIPPEQFLTQDRATATLNNWLKNLSIHKNNEIKIYEKTLELRQANEKIVETALQTERAQHAKALAEAQNEAKSQFLHHVSHEMRTPLNGIIATCSTLEQSPSLKTKEDKDSLDIIKDSAEHLLTVIKDILDLALVESGKLTIDPQPMSISSCVDGVMKMVAHHKLGDKTVSCTIADSVPPRVIVDQIRLKQVLLNLISNGIKFSTEPARIELGVKASRKVADSCYLEFSVKDNGIGISPESFPALFKPFSQVDTRVTRKFDGTGLGLSICKKIVEVMNGTIWLESTEGEGSTFFFSIPVKISTSEPVPMLTSPTTIEEKKLTTTSPLDILVVEDNLVNQKVICRILNKLGHKSITALNGVQAIELAKKQHFNVIFMDLNMPEMGGLEATMIINSLDWSHSQRPSIIALTACAFKEDKLNCLQAGMDDFVSKPFTLNTIQTVLENYMNTKLK